MAYAIPAWKLRELLDIDELRQEREKNEEEILSYREPVESGAVFDSAEADTDDSSFTRKDFLNALGRVSQAKDDEEEKDD